MSFEVIGSWENFFKNFFVAVFVNDTNRREINFEMQSL